MSNVVRKIIDAVGPSRFSFDVDTTNTGSASDTMIIPLVSGESYDFLVHWGDGSTESYVSSVLSSITHTYSSGGIYTIKISGTFPRIFFNNGGDRLKMLSINNWGNIVWSSMAVAFFGCSNMTANYSDFPDLSTCINLNGMFRNCTVFNGSIAGSNCDLVVDAGNLFFSCNSYNQSLPSMPIVAVLVSALRNTSFNRSIDNLPMLSVTNAATFMSGVSTFSQENYDSWLTVIDGTALNSSVSIHFGATKYSNTSGHNYLTVTKTWTVADGGLA